MPTVPIYEQKTTTPDPGDQSVPLSVTQPPPALNPALGTQAEEKGVQELGQVSQAVGSYDQVMKAVSAVGDKIQDQGLAVGTAMGQSQFNINRTLALSDLMDLQAQIKADPDLKRYGPNYYTEQAKAIQDKYSQGLGPWASWLQTDLTMATARGLSEVKTQQINQAHSDLMDSLASSLPTNAQAMAQADGDPDAQKAITQTINATLDQAEAGGYLRASQRGKIMQQFQQMTATQQVKRDLENFTGTSMAAILADPKSATETYPNLTEQAREGLLVVAKSNAQQEANDDQEQLITTTTSNLMRQYGNNWSAMFGALNNPDMVDELGPKGVRDVMSTINAFRAKSQMDIADSQKAQTLKYNQQLLANANDPVATDRVLRDMVNNGYLDASTYISHQDKNNQTQDAASGEVAKANIITQIYAGGIQQPDGTRVPLTTDMAVKAGVKPSEISGLMTLQENFGNKPERPNYFNQALEQAKAIYKDAPESLANYTKAFSYEVQQQGLAPSDPKIMDLNNELMKKTGGFLGMGTSRVGDVLGKNMSSAPVSQYKGAASSGLVIPNAPFLDADDSADLVKTYGSDNANQAAALLKQNNKPVTIQNIKTVLQNAQQARGQQ